MKEILLSPFYRYRNSPTGVQCYHHAARKTGFIPRSVTPSCAPFAGKDSRASCSIEVSSERACGQHNPREVTTLGPPDQELGPHQQRQAHNSQHHTYEVTFQTLSYSLCDLKKTGIYVRGEELGFNSFEKTNLSRLRWGTARRKGIWGIECPQTFPSALRHGPAK